MRWRRPRRGTDRARAEVLRFFLIRHYRHQCGEPMIAGRDALARLYTALATPADGAVDWDEPLQLFRCDGRRLNSAQAPGAVRARKKSTSLIGANSLRRQAQRSPASRSGPA
jgi:hypothetical protein